MLATPSMLDPTILEDAMNPAENTWTTPVKHIPGLADANADQATIRRIREIARDHMLAILSEARSLSVGMDSELREKLMTDLTTYLHPDGQAADLISDAFSGAELRAELNIMDLGG